MKDELFRISGADAGYSRNRFIRNLSFTVFHGDFVALIGPNGAGKSTILKLLAGVIKPFSGVVEFTGRDIRSCGRRELARSFSVVSRISGEMPDFPVQKFISLGRFPFYGILDDDENFPFEEMAARTGISHLLHRSILELSAGEFQLVQITRALVQNSSILLLDEPVSNLDYPHVTLIMDLLKGLNRKGTTVICALHDVNAALDYCNRIAAVKNGNLVFDGVPDDVINAETMGMLYGSSFYCGRNPVTGRNMVLPIPGDYA